MKYMGSVYLLNPGTLLECENETMISALKLIISHSIFEFMT